MKKLAGMEKSFSSLENKKMKNLNNIFGGLMAGGSNNQTSIASSEAAAGAGCSDMDYYTDGVWQKRLTACATLSRRKLIIFDNEGGIIPLSFNNYSNKK
ncbi:hypothetical protein [Chryseobacterium wanjuense]